jgi:HSP20 family protein
MAEKTVPAPSGSPANITRENNINREDTRARELYAQPPVDIYETDKELVLMADMPGVSKEDLQVRVDDDLLTIQGKAKHLVPGDPVYREIELTGFYRQFEIIEGIEVDKIDAELKNGVLSLHLAKMEKPQPKEIEVKVS